MGGLYAGCFGSAPGSVTALGAAGSARRYYRLAGAGGTAVGTWGGDRVENRAFIDFSAALRSRGVAVPRVLASDAAEGCYIQQDLGDTSLFSLLHTPQAPGLVAQTMQALAKLQVSGRSLVEGGAVWQPPFGKRQMMFDLNYFKYEYLKPTDIPFDEEALEDDFGRLADDIARLTAPWLSLMHRDFQSRNVMVSEGKPWIIDFQGARLGPALYDAVSFLWQARAAFSDEERREYLNIYTGAFLALSGREAERDEFLRPLWLLVLLRTLQTLGAYGLRGLVQRKSHFIESIPGALHTLRQLAERGTLSPYPELERIAVVLASDPRFKQDTEEGLTVEVVSFSYKKGYPADYSGNGGGFMFDCRALHNPGRYDEYKPLTGMDAPVKEFLEQRGEIQPFLASAWEMTDKAVERYLQRGFTRLQIGFGCTGGRHRSVYSAEATAQHIKQQFGNQVRVHLVHREQDKELLL